MPTRTPSNRFRLLLALGLVALPLVGARAQDSPPREAERQTPAEAERQARTREAEERRDAARAAREAELKRLAERIRQQQEAIEDAARDEDRVGERRQARSEGLRNQRDALLADLAVLELHLEVRKDAVRMAGKLLTEAEIQNAIREGDPANPGDEARVDRLRRIAGRYESQLRETLARQASLQGQVAALETQMEGLSAGPSGTRPGARSVAGSVGRLLERLNEEGAIDERDRRRATEAVGVIDELLNLFREPGEPATPEPVDRP
jgi:hypothetical protein